MSESCLSVGNELACSEKSKSFDHIETMQNPIKISDDDSPNLEYKFKVP